MAYEFAVPETLVGKTLQQLNDEAMRTGGQHGRVDLFARDLGIDPNSAFTKGQFLNYGGTEQAPLNVLSSWFGSPLNAQQKSDILQKQALSARQQAIQPAVQSLEASLPEQAQKFQTERTRLESEKDPLKQRYQLVLDELKRRESRDVGDVNTALAREFGRRGIPLSSGIYEQTGIEKRQPLSEFYGIQGREAGATYEEGSRNITNLLNQLVPQETEANRVIRNAIAQLQAGAGTGAIEDAFRQLKFMEEQRQFNESTILQKAQQEINQRLADAQIAKYNQPEQEDPYKRFTTLGEGEQLYDLSTLRSIFKNPKTFKVGGGDGDSY